LDACRLAQEMRERIADRCNALLPDDWGLTAAIGVAVFPDAAHDPESLLRAADIALYRAKDSGVDGVMLADFAPAGAATRGAKLRRGSSRRESP
jgi:GGDEF domain-containing protein